MFDGMLTKTRLCLRLIEQTFQLVGQRANISIFESYTTRADRFFQSAVFRADNNATTCDSFQCDNAERLRPARRNDENSMSIQKLGQSDAGFLSCESYLSI